MKKILLFLVFILSTTQTSLASETDPYFRFSDDSTIKNWTYESVQELRKSGIMTGFNDGSFQPEKAVSRAEALTLLFKVNDIEVTDIDESVLEPFTDVSPDKWYAAPFAFAIKEGWINGYEDNTLRPHSPVTRAEWTVLVQKIYDLESTLEKQLYFIDVDDDAWYKDSINALYRYGLLFNDNVYDFLPRAALTRQETAWLTYALVQKQRLFIDRDDVNQAWRKNRVATDRSIWYKDRNFVDKQGTEVQRKTLSLNAKSVVEKATVKRGEDFVEIGTIELANAFEKETSFNSLELRVRFDSIDVGPAGRLELKLIIDDTEIVKPVERSGLILFSQLPTIINPESTKDITLYARATQDGAYLANSGDVSISLVSAKSWKEEPYVGEENESRSELNRKATPLSFETQTFNPFYFVPTLD